jgi:hypothetical protein
MARTLAGLRVAPTADLRTVSIDLRHDWPAAMRDAGLDSDRRASSWSVRCNSCDYDGLATRCPSSRPVSPLG